MHPLSMLMLGLAMSTDAFAAALGRGAAMPQPTLPQALRIAAVFGTAEALSPLAGWALGRVAAPYVAAWDHWIAFALLVGLGLHMSLSGLRHPRSPERAPRLGAWALMAAGLATSIDALVVGAGLALVDVNILVVATVIGLSTVAMVTAGVLLGHALGRLAGRHAEVGGGILLMVVGVAILASHLGTP